MLFVLTLTMTACNSGSDDNNYQNELISFSGKTLDAGSVGEPYEASVGVAQGAENISYSLKVGSHLPIGLSLASTGMITGTPTEEVEALTFTVVASAINTSDAEATFIITILAPGLNNFVFETEYTNLEGLQGGGISGAPSTPLDMILSSENASNGYYLGFPHRTGFNMSYEFTSSSSGSAELVIRLGTEIGQIAINPQVLEIKVNGAVISYGEFIIPDNTDTLVAFNNYIIGDISLVEGDNIITITVLENRYLNGHTGGPLFDNISLTTQNDLTWQPLLSNLS